MIPAKALALGILQGLTEFLPISSSGHLVVFSETLGTKLGQNVAFDVALHAATLLAVLVYFRRRVVAILRGMMVRSGSLGGEGRVGWLILLGTVPAGLVGLLFRGEVERSFSSASTAGACFLVTAAVLVLADRLRGGKRAREMGPLDALLIGAAQAAALLPGISRSGSTIAAGLWRGLSKEEAPQFSFLLSVPAILGATALEAREMLSGPIRWTELAAGFGAAFLSGLLAIWAMLGIVRARKLKAFSFYLVPLGVAALVVSAMR